MDLQIINEKIQKFVGRVNVISNVQIFTIKIKNKKIEKILVLFFILLYVFFVLYLYKIEAISFTVFVIGTLIFAAIYLYYFFQPVIITKIIFYTLLLLAPLSIYLRLQEFSQKESQLTANIIEKISPQLLHYQYYILFGTYLIFEILFWLLSKNSKKIRARIQKNNFTIRFYFFMTLAVINILLDIFT